MGSSLTRPIAYHLQVVDGTRLVLKDTHGGVPIISLPVPVEGSATSHVSGPWTLEMTHATVKINYMILSMSQLQEPWPVSTTTNNIYDVICSAFVLTILCCFLASVVLTTSGEVCDFARKARSDRHWFTSAKMFIITDIFLIHVRCNPAAYYQTIPAFTYCQVGDMVCSSERCYTYSAAGEFTYNNWTYSVTRLWDITVHGTDLYDGFRLIEPTKKNE